jgi:predicted nucleic acid-binding protein
MGGAAEVVLDASAALEMLLPDSEKRFALSVELFEQIGSGRLFAHVPLIFFNEVAAGCARAVRGGRTARVDADSFLQSL